MAAIPPPTGEPSETPGGGGGSLVRAFNLNFGEDGEAQGIKDNKRETINNKHDANGLYTLDGMRLDGKPTKKGLYIVNGKKVVIPQGIICSTEGTEIRRSYAQHLLSSKPP